MAWHICGDVVNDVIRLRSVQGVVVSFKVVRFVFVCHGVSVQGDAIERRQGDMHVGNHGRLSQQDGLDEVQLHVGVLVQEIEGVAAERSADVVDQLREKPARS